MILPVFLRITPELLRFLAEKCLPSTLSLSFFSLITFHCPGIVQNIEFSFIQEGMVVQIAVTFIINCTNLNCFQVYSIYKQRQAVEQFFKTYGDTMENEASYMRDNYSEEA